MTPQDLRKKLNFVNHKSYGMYKELQGNYVFPDYLLCIDHVQGDPFAAPSRVRVRIPEKSHQMNPKWYDARQKKRALEDYLLRQFGASIRRYENRNMGSGKSGSITTCRTGQEVLERIAVVFDKNELEVRMEIGFPARGRTILADELETILFSILPQIVEHAFYRKRLNEKEIEKRILLAVEQEMIRRQMKEKGMIAFLADGSILPRESGVSERPMKDAVPFASPESMRVTMELPQGRTITGMGIPRGITVITGGGYHGKSTLLKALERGVYDHILGDGREYVLTDESAWKVRAEDGRYIRECDISPFISNLPGGQDTRVFSSLNASGSTSQAANVIEGIESGTKVFLIDEDTTATNFMVRDEWMSQLVADEKEPITPFIRKIRSLYEDRGISTVIVVGSSGDYLTVADHVLQMDRYRIKDVTERAMEISRQIPVPKGQTFPDMKFEKPFTGTMATDKYGDYKIKTGGCDTLVINKETIDLRYLEQIADPGQLAALGAMLRHILKHGWSGKRTKQQIVDALYEEMEKNGFLSVIPKGYSAGHPVMPRKQEVYGMLNRWRR